MTKRISRTRHGEDCLQSRIGLDHAALVQLVLLDVLPDLLRDFRASQRLRTADARERRGESLLGEDTSDKANAHPPHVAFVTF